MSAADDLKRITDAIRAADEYAENPDGDALKERPELRRIVTDGLQRQQLQNFEPKGSAN